MTQRLGIPALITTAIVVEVAMLLVIPRYVTVDGAAHVGGAALLRDVFQGAGEVHLRYVTFADFPAPNLLPGLLLAAAMLIADPPTAERLMQIGYVVALPIAMLYAVRSVSRGNEWLALLALPLTFTFAFQFGFYDFSYGVAFFLIAAGYAWRHGETPSLRHAIVLGALALLVYFTHLVPLLELLVYLAVVWVSALLGAWRLGGLPAATARARATVPLILGVLPAASMAAVFLVATRSGAPAEYLNPVLQAIGVASLALGLATTHPLEIAVAVGLSMTLAALLIVVVRRRARARHFDTRGRVPSEDALFVFATVALVLALLAPAAVESGGSYIPERLALFPVYGLALWLAAHEIPRQMRAVAATVFVAAAIALVAVRLPVTLNLSAAAVELESIAPCLAHEATLFQADLSDLPAGPLARTDPFGDEAGRVAAATRGHDLSNWEGSFPFFLYRNRPENDPFLWLATDRDGFEVPPAVDIERFRTRRYGSVDYVLVVGRAAATSETLSSPGWTSLSSELGRAYQEVAISAGGLVEVWERRDPLLESAGAARRAAAGASHCGTQHSAP